MPNILVVDDKDSMRNMLFETLSEEGYRVDAASDGQKAIDLVRNKSYDLVLTDLRMPDIDGLQVLSQVKEVDSETSVIVMTAYGTIEDAVSAMKSGAYDFITKPFDTEHLCVLVGRALENRRLVAENFVLRQEILADHGLENIIGQRRSRAVMPPCCFRENPAPVRNFLHELFIICPRGKTAPISRSTAPLSPANYSRTSCSARRRERLPGRMRGRWVSLRLPTAELFSSMK